MSHKNAMKLIIITLALCVLLAHRGLSSREALKCENEGCYEVIKTFAKLLDEKINETDKILAEAEKELNDVAFGRAEDFRNKINEIDHKLTMLIIDLNTGIEGGEHTLFELINTVFKAVNQADTNVNQLELTIESGSKLKKIADLEFTEVSDAIRQVQEEFNKLQNDTETDLPMALQDAFDKSEKFDDDSAELKEVLDKMKLALRDYESNLLSAKDLTEQAIEKFTATSEQIDETKALEQEVEELLEIAGEQKFPIHEFDYMKKLSEDALAKSETVFDDSLDVLNEVSLLELNSKLDDIKSYVSRLESYSHEQTGDLKKFSEENEKFLNDMEDAMDAAEEIKTRALKQLDELMKIHSEAEEIQEMSTTAIGDKEEIIQTAKSIYRTLEEGTYTMKVEESRENALRALETIPQIVKEIEKSAEIVKQLEESVGQREQVVQTTKEKCNKVQDDTDAVRKESDGILKSAEEIADELNSVSDETSTLSADLDRIFKEIDRLKSQENETEDTILEAKEKVAPTKERAEQVDKSASATLEVLKKLADEVEAFKSVDDKSLEDFEKKIDELESEIEAKELNRKFDEMKAQQRQQEELMGKYRKELAFLEHQVKTIKENEESLEDKCFKRTRLEP